MAYSFERFRAKLNDIQKRLVSEFSSIRTGRVNPVLLDGVYVEAYGGRLPLRQFGSITVEDARTLKITLWDRPQFKNVEAAVQKANLGVTVLTAPDGASLRLLFPELTEEKRKLLIKLMSTQVEAARASLRQEREKVWHDIQVKERNGEISEDDKFKLKDELQKIVDGGNKKFVEMGQRKEAEILN